MAGAERRQPQVQVAVEHGLVEHRQHGRQRQRLAVERAQAGARPADALGSGRHDAHPRIAAASAEHHLHGAAHVFQPHGGVGIGAGRPGDAPVPELAVMVDT